MTAYVDIKNRIIDTATTIVPSVAMGAVSGYCYAKFSDLPPNQVAKGWAICFVASDSLMSLVNYLVEPSPARFYSKTILWCAVNSIGCLALQKRNLIGNKMMLVSIAVNIFYLGFVLVIYNRSHLESFANAECKNLETLIEELTDELKKDPGNVEKADSLLETESVLKDLKLNYQKYEKLLKSLFEL